MNGIGIGTAVALGCIIGLGIVAPGAQTIEFFATAGFYGGMSGLLYELYRWAFTTNWRPLGPGRRR
jgi:hypothetical protein